MPRVSIITPTYNHAAFIDQCVKSVLDQTFEDWEMIVVDDESTDETAEIVSAQSDPRIRLVRQQRHGLERLYQTYNNALELATGQFVAILEGDDYWPPNKLELQVPQFDPGVVLVSGIRRIVDVDGNPADIDEIVPDERAKLNQPLGEAALALLDVRHLTFTFPVSTMLLRSTLVQMGGFQQPSYLRVLDLPTFVAMARFGEFRWVDDVCGYWRRHEHSTTKSRLPEILDGVYRFAGEWSKSESGSYAFPPERVDAWKQDWSAFMVHRCVLLALMLNLEGDRKKAAQAAQLAASFGGPPKRKLKALAAKVGLALRLPEPLFRTMTGLTGSTNQVTQYDRLVDEGTLDRVKPWF